MSKNFGKKGQRTALDALVIATPVCNKSVIEEARKIKKELHDIGYEMVDRGPKAKSAFSSSFGNLKQEDRWIMPVT